MQSQATTKALCWQQQPGHKGMTRTMHGLAAALLGVQQRLHGIPSVARREGVAGGECADDEDRHGFLSGHYDLRSSGAAA